MMISKKARFPLGHDITLDELSQDPYPVFARLRAREPITWVPALDMWYVVGYEDVRTALFDSVRLTTASAQSTIFDTFGAQVLTTEGATHDRYRQAAKQPFNPAFIRAPLEEQIRVAASTLVDEFKAPGQADLRAGFASRLPVQVMLGVCGMPLHVEPLMRRWYDSFEASLANFTGDAGIRAAARRSVAEFHAMLDTMIESIQAADEHTLLAGMVKAPAGG